MYKELNIFTETLSPSWCNHSFSRIIITSNSYPIFYSVLTLLMFIVILLSLHSLPTGHLNSFPIHKTRSFKSICCWCDRNFVYNLKHLFKYSSWQIYFPLITCIPPTNNWSVVKINIKSSNANTWKESAFSL